MKFAWLEELLPEAMLSPRTKIWWALFFALFPFAYWGGVALERADEAPARMMGYQDRAASIRTAAEFAATKGFAVTAWPRYAILETHSNLLTYYETHQDPELLAINRVAPAREVQVLFRSPDQNHEFRVYLSLSGEVTGYDFGRTSASEGKTTNKLGVLNIDTAGRSGADDDDGA